MSKHLIYVTHGEEGSSVYATQVIELLNTWVNKDNYWKVTLIQISENEMFNGLDEKVTRIHVKRNAKYPFNEQKKKYIKDIYYKLNEKESYQELYFNSRGTFAYSITTKFLNKYNIKFKKNNLDVRGIVEEFKYSILGLLAYPLLATQQRRVIKKATSITTVSEALKNYLIEKYKIPNIKNEIKVIPTLSILNYQTTDEERKDVLFIGKIAWIRKKEFLKHTLILNEKLVEKGWKITMIGNPDRIKEMEEKGIEFIDRMSPEDLSEKVVKYRSGLILRDKSIVNKVAAPCKIADYLCLGIPIIYSGDIGSLYDFTKKYPETKKNIINIEEIFNDDILLKFMKISESEMKELSEKAKTYFGKHSVVDNYIESLTANK